MLSNVTEGYHALLTSRSSEWCHTVCVPEPCALIKHDPLMSTLSWFWAWEDSLYPLWKGLSLFWDTLPNVVVSHHAFQNHILSHAPSGDTKCSPSCWNVQTRAEKLHLGHHLLVHSHYLWGLKVQRSPCSINR